MRVYAVRAAVHYRPARGSHPCKADVRPWCSKRFTTDVQKVTCRYCLAWLVRTATAELDAWKKAEAMAERERPTPDSIRRRARGLNGG